MREYISTLKINFKKIGFLKNFTNLHMIYNFILKRKEDDILQSVYVLL